MNHSCRVCVDKELYSATLNNFLGTEPVILRNLGQQHYSMKSEYLPAWLNGETHTHTHLGVILKSPCVFLFLLYFLHFLKYLLDLTILILSLLFLFFLFLFSYFLYSFLLSSSFIFLVFIIFFLFPFLSLLYNSCSFPLSISTLSTVFLSSSSSSE